MPYGNLLSWWRIGADILHRHRQLFRDGRRFSVQWYSSTRLLCRGDAVTPMPRRILHAIVWIQRMPAMPNQYILPRGRHERPIEVRAFQRGCGICRMRRSASRGGRILLQCNQFYCISVSSWLHLSHQRESKPAMPQRHLSARRRVASDAMSRAACQWNIRPIFW